MTRGALERHFERLGLSVEFDDKRRFNIRDVTFSLTAPARVAIIIPTKNPDDRLWKCVASLESTIPLELAEIVILDQSSGEGTTRTSLDKMAERHHQVLRFEGMAGASALLNQGATELRSATHYFFLHDDIEAIAPGWFEHMLGYAQRADVGIVGGTLAYPDGRIQHFGSVIGLNGTHGHVLKYAHLCVPGHGRCGGPNGIMLASRDVSAVTDACMLVRADVFDRLGGFDQKLDGRYHDLDLCLRARALGYKVIQDAYAVLCHEENEAGVAWPCRPHSRSQWRFFARHGRSLLAGDPFYSPMLSSSSTDMTLAPMARAAEAATFRTVPLVLPGRNNRPKPFRLDTASAFQPNVRLSRFVASIGQRDQQTSAV
jgi:GT2 family glycosyltransferase